MRMQFIGKFAAIAAGLTIAASGAAFAQGNVANPATPATPAAPAVSATPAKNSADKPKHAKKAHAKRSHQARNKARAHSEKAPA